MKIHIYQPTYDAVSRRNVSKFAIEYYLDNNNPELYEYQVYLKLLNRKKYEECDYIGVFSTKFALKARLSILDVISWIKENPGFDVYTFNPFPCLSYFHFNQWEHGEYCHPGIKELAQKVFDKYNLGSVETAPRMRSVDSLYCNFWIGTRSFFKDYIELVEDIINFMMGSKDIFFSKTIHRGELSSPFLTFILERLISHYILSKKSTVKKSAFMYPDDLMNIMIDDFSVAEGFERGRYLMQTIRPLIDSLDAKYYDRPDCREIYIEEFNKINQESVLLREQHQDPFELSEAMIQLKDRQAPDSSISLSFLRPLTRNLFHQLFAETRHFAKTQGERHPLLADFSNSTKETYQNSLLAEPYEKEIGNSDLDIIQFLAHGCLWSITYDYGVLRREYSQCHICLEKTTSELNLYKAELQNTQSYLNLIQTELQNAQSELNHVRLDLQKTHERLKDEQSKSLKLSQDIKAMESSKFWKLRQFWMKLRYIIKPKIIDKGNELGP